MSYRESKLASSGMAPTGIRSADGTTSERLRRKCKERAKEGFDQKYCEAVLKNFEKFGNTA